MNSLQEALAEGLEVTGIGLLIVFAVLLILMFVLMAMKQIFYKDPAKESAKTAAAPEPIVNPEPVPETAMDEGELIAVLTAAVAASLNTSTYNLQIKSYRRIGQSSPAWHKAGISDTINSRY